MGGPQSIPDNGHTESGKIEAERPFRRNPDDPADNVTGGFNQSARAAAKSTDSDEVRVRDEAYRLWEEAGRPEGDPDRFWYAAIAAQRRTEGEA